MKLTALYHQGKTPEEVKQYSKVFWKRCKELKDYEVVVQAIEKGEAKGHKREETANALQTKVGWSWV